jgi:4-amino-4-deoxy-L-arabinose transferase-like glycosyltransferase
MKFASNVIRLNRVLAPVLRSPMLAVAAAFALRMVLLWLSHRREDLSHPRFETVGLEAHLVAASLAAGKGFFGPYPRYQALTAWVAPVYPFLWAIGEKLFHLNFYRSTVFGQAMHCVFSAATCWPIFAIGKRVFSRSIGLASAWLWVSLPYAVLLPLEWTWDQSLSALLLASIVVMTLVLRESGSSLSMTGYGLLWAFAALTNPTLCILLPFLLGWMMVRPRQAARLSLASAAKIIFIFILALVPWTVRNYYVLDGLVFVKSNAGLEFWLGNNPAVREIYSAERHPLNDREELISLILNGEPNYNREKQRQAIAFIETHPRVFLRNVFERFEDTWSATYDSRVEPWILTLHFSRMDVWFCLVFSILSFVGMILALRANWQDVLPLAMCVLLLPMPYYLTHTALRYRHPIDPFMTIFTVYAISRCGLSLRPLIETVHWKKVAVVQSSNCGLVFKRPRI